MVGVSMIIGSMDRRDEQSLLAVGTPEGTVQRYLVAIEERKIDAAYSYLVPGLQEDCDRQYFHDSLRDFPGGRYTNGMSDTDDIRVTLLNTVNVEDRVEVNVRITRFTVSPPFGADEYSHGQRFVLKQTEGSWAFIEPPWPMSSCLEARISPNR